MSSRTIWEQANIDEDKFKALINLAHVLKVEHATPTSPEPGEDTLMFGHLNAHHLSGMQNKDLKNLLLDRLADLFSHRNGVYHGVATSLTQLTDKAVLTVQMQSRFTFGDEQLCEMLQSTIRQLRLPRVVSQDWDKALELEKSLWSYLTRHLPSDNRFYGYQQSLKVLVTTCERPIVQMAPCPESKLLQSLFEAANNDTNSLETVAHKAYQCRILLRPAQLAAILDKSIATGVWTHICLLAQLRITFKTILCAAKQLPKFDQIEIRIDRTYSNIHEDNVKARRVWTAAEMQKDSNEYRMSVSQAEAFNILQQGESELYTELQMIAHHACDLQGFRHSHNYIGLCKPDCSICSVLLQTLEKFKSRDPHARRNSWTLPEHPFAKDQAKALRIAAMLQSMEAYLKKEIHKMQVSNKEAVTMAETIKEMSTMHLDVDDSKDTLSDHLFRAMILDTIPGDPNVREAFGFGNCALPEHQNYLLGLFQGLTTLDIGPEELEDWRLGGTMKEGVIEAYEQLPKSNQGGYYPWFLEHQYVLDQHASGQADQLRNAEVMKVAENVIASRNKYLDLTVPQYQSRVDCALLYATLEHGWLFTPNQDEWYTFGFCVCQSEREEGWLGSLYKDLIIGKVLLSQPNLGQTMEDQLCRSGPLCTFDEFWSAYCAGSLAQLMDHHGCNVDQKEIKHFRAFSGLPEHVVKPKVWKLAQALAVDGDEMMIDEAYSLADFGLLNCKVDKDRKILREFYKKFIWSGDPFRLDEEAKKGKVLEYAEQVLGAIEEDVKRLLRKE